MTSADERLLSRSAGSFLAINEAEPLLALGRWDDALRVAAGAMNHYLAPTPMPRATLHVITGTIALARGSLEPAAASLHTARDALRSARHEDQHQLPLARFEIVFALAVDGPAAAVAATSRVLDRFELSGSGPRYAWPVVAAGASAVLAAVRQAGTARDERLFQDAAGVAERLRTVAEKLEVFGPEQRASQLTAAAADLDAFGEAGAGGAAGAGGLGGAAGPGLLLGAWDQAAEAWAGLSEPYPAGQALVHAASAALAGGDRDGAAERLERAASLAAGLGAGPLREQVTVLARRARIRLAGDDGPADPIGSLGLTERETEVLRLVAAGRSNREIAGELFISPKTASVHVSNILGKLNVASRGEAAATAHTLHLFDHVDTASPE
jgi:DNA-binding CsgD family transcriptional regulator